MSMMIHRAVLRQREALKKQEAKEEKKPVEAKKTPAKEQEDANHPAPKRGRKSKR